MKLTQKDLEQYLKLHQALLHFTNQKEKIIQNTPTINDLLNLETPKLIKIRNTLYTHPDIIDAYITENPHNITKDEQKIILQWKKPLNDTFFLIKYHKKHAI